MKTMKDFAAQQLTKKQMNEVKGGAGQMPYQTWECHWGDQMTIIAEKDFPQLAEEMAGTGLEVRCHMV